jgi:antirestriction protein ArdC
MAASQSRSRKTYESPTAEEKIVALLIELMEAGSAPWRRPWDGSGGGHHVNLLSGHRNRGANPILLTLGMHIRGSATPFWCGFAEARKHGIYPRKGSKAVHILRPQLHSREEPGVGGEATLRSWASYRPVAVFNAADLEGEALPGLVEACKAAEGVDLKPEPKRLEEAEAVLGSWPVPVSFGGDRACYMPAIGSSCPIAPASTRPPRTAPPGPMSRSTPQAIHRGSRVIWAVSSGSRAMPVRSWSPN